MKATFKLTIVLLFIHFLMTSSGGSAEKEYCSFPMMNMRIRHSMEENTRQKLGKKKQTTTTSQETLNNTQWKKFQEVKTKIQDRLRFVSFALQAIPTGIAITQQSQKIIKTQASILDEINDSPYLAVPFLPTEIRFVDDMQMNVRLMVGIVISYGAINQMEKTDRKVLLDFALDEMKKLEKDSFRLLFLIRDWKRKIRFQKNVMANYYNMDKKIVENIMKNIKSF